MATTDPRPAHPNGELATQNGNPLPDPQEGDPSGRLHAPRCPRCDGIIWEALRGNLGADVRAVAENATLAARFEARARMLEPLLLTLAAMHPGPESEDSRLDHRLFDEVDFAARRPVALYAARAARAAQVLVMRYDLPGAEDLRAAGVRPPDCQGP